jgi:very-short-patch-repair endonuclease
MTAKDPPKPRGSRRRALTRKQRIDPKKLEIARGRRKKPTPSEKLAWSIVRDRRLFGLKFRREQPLDGFWLDLYCTQLRACIEIDGGVHKEPAQAECDAERARVIERNEIRVLRIAADRVNREAIEALVRPLLEVERAQTSFGSVGE